MKKSYTSNMILAITLGLSMAVCVIVHALKPMIVLPGFTVSNVTAVCLVALLSTHYLTGSVSHDGITLVLGVLSFGLLPACAGLTQWQTAWKLALLGGAVFFVLSFLFAQMQNRLKTGPAAKAAPILSAFGLYLAMQCF